MCGGVSIARSEVWTWGSGGVTRRGGNWTTGGVMGTGSWADEPTPRRVDGLAGVPVVQVACGSDHTLALSAAVCPILFVSPALPRSARRHRLF